MYNSFNHCKFVTPIYRTVLLNHRAVILSGA
jgi:hypothetical protein